MKIKITCTKEEKENFIKSQFNVYLCEYVGVGCPKDTKCDDCFDKLVEWEVTDDGCGKG